MFLEAFQALLLDASQPFAYGRDGGGESAGCGLDPVLAAMGDETKSIIESVLHVTNRVEIRDRSSHGLAILQFKTGATALFPPKAATSLLRFSLRHFNPTGGCDGSRLYHVPERLDSEA